MINSKSSRDFKINILNKFNLNYLYDDGQRSIPISTLQTYNAC